MKKLLQNKWLFLLALTISVLIICFAISLTVDRLMTPKVTLTTIKEGPLNYSYNTKVTIQQEGDITITASSEGVIENVAVLPFEHVSKGTVLVTLGNGEALVAPADAIILAIHTENGSHVQEGDVLFSLITSGRDITVSITLPQAKGAFYTVGDQAKIKAIKGNRIISGTGQVISIVPTDDFLNYRLEILIPNSNSNFAHGDVLHVDLNKTTEIFSCLVPRSALIPTTEEGRYYLYTATPKEDSAEYEVYRHVVDVIGENDLYAAIRQNYGSGTYVVTSTDRALGERTTVRTE